mmetsp:Transcript_18928/g.66862  ORF Transcript_18928/g.66862 Transcript_18928/m.66862 type:complete len:205 (+) Transcript_18928:181-795(+)
MLQWGARQADQERMGGSVASPRSCAWRRGPLRARTTAATAAAAAAARRCPACWRRGRSSGGRRCTRCCACARATQRRARTWTRRAAACCLPLPRCWCTAPTRAARTTQGCPPPPSRGERPSRAGRAPPPARSYLASSRARRRLAGLPPCARRCCTRRWRCAALRAGASSATCLRWRPPSPGPTPRASSASRARARSDSASPATT